MKKTQHIGILGASFDPIHQGHIQPALSVCEQLALDAIWLMPNQSPPYKQASSISDEHRWAMVQIAANLSPHLMARSDEMQKETFQYTRDSLAELAHSHPDVQFYFLMGGDSFVHLQAWHDWQNLTEDAHLVVYGRPQYSLKELNPILANWAKPLWISAPELVKSRPTSGRLCQINTPQIDISSTQIRAAYKERRMLSGALLLEEITQYIQQHGLYR